MMSPDVSSASGSSEPRLDLCISAGKVYSIAADVTLDVYVYVAEHDDAEAFTEVMRFRSGGDLDVRSITKLRQRVDEGDLSRRPL